MLIQISLDRTSEVEFEIFRRCGLLVRKEVHRVTVVLTSISIIHHLLQHQVWLDGVECTREVQEQQSYIRFRLLQVFVHMMKQCQYGILGDCVRGNGANCIASC